jgi:uncharacterized RDD family membrane protein YckC
MCSPDLLTVLQTDPHSVARWEEQEGRMTQPTEQQQPDDPITPQADETGPAEPHGSDRGQRPHIEHIGGWRRLIAAGIDALIVTVIALVVNSVIWGYHRATHAAEESTAHRVLSDLVSLVYAIPYFAVPHARWGQTPGKRAMGIRVVRASDGGAIGYGQAIWRYVFTSIVSILVTVIASMGGVFGLAGVAGLVESGWVLWDPRRQALHDKAARTVVVKAGPGLPNPYDDR